MFSIQYSPYSVLVEDATWILFDDYLSCLFENEQELV